jgi:DNA-directed RNA polymerase specialized sigma subunit
MNKLVFLRSRRTPFGFRNKKAAAPVVELTRDQQIVELRKGGRTFSSIAGEFGVSTARIQQICKKEIKNG